MKILVGLFLLLLSCSDPLSSGPEPIRIGEGLWANSSLGNIVFIDGINKFTANSFTPVKLYRETGDLLRYDTIQTKYIQLSSDCTHYDTIKGTNISKSYYKDTIVWWDSTPTFKGWYNKTSTGNIELCFFDVQSSNGSTGELTLNSTGYYSDLFSYSFSTTPTGYMMTMTELGPDYIFGGGIAHFL